jgi:hypothetical protein
LLLFRAGHISRSKHGAFLGIWRQSEKITRQLSFHIFLLLLFSCLPFNVALLAPSTTIMPQFVLFGASLTEWSFSETTQGFGHFLQQKYQYKVAIVNEGRAKCGFGKRC